MATTSHVQLFKYGQSSFVVHNTDFEDGYANGLLSHETFLLTDSALTEYVIKNMLDTHASREWNAGYILGIALSLLLGKPDTMEPDAPQVQLGSVSLRLNNWRFREGFSVGQDDYQATQRERVSSPLVTVNELLRSVAHYDDERNRYFLDELEREALEDTLGRFTGFLCAALFSPTTERITEPLPNAIVHEAEESEACRLTRTLPQRPDALVLREIDLGRHHLLLLSDQRVELLAQEEPPSGVTCVLSLDHEETYRLLLCLQDLFRQEGE